MREYTKKYPKVEMTPEERKEFNAYHAAYNKVHAQYYKDREERHAKMVSNLRAIGVNDVGWEAIPVLDGSQVYVKVETGIAMHQALGFKNEDMKLDQRQDCLVGACDNAVIGFLDEHADVYYIYKDGILTQHKGENIPIDKPTRRPSNRVKKVKAPGECPVLF